MLAALALASAFLLASDTADVAEVTLTFDIKKGGDVRWKNEPCRGEVLVDKDAREVDDAASVAVPKGKDVDVVIACAANEGVLKRSFRVKASRDQTIAAPFDPGFLNASIEREGRLSVGTIVVYDERDHEIARGKDRAVLPVPAGKVRVVAIIDKATAAATRDVRGEARAKIEPNKKTELKLDASDGELVVSVSENGRPAKALIALREPGQANRVIEITPQTPVSVPAGTWDIVTQLEEAHDFREQLTKGVVIEPRKRTTKSIAHSTGRLVAVVDKALLPPPAPPAPEGTTPPAPEGSVVVDLLLPGASAGFNQIDPNSEARLTPGRYVVRATKDRVLDDGTKPTAEATVSVGAGGTTRAVVNPAVAHIDVEVRVGGEARPLPVDVLLPGATAALVSRAANAAGVASFDVAPQSLVVMTTLTTPQGPLVQKKPLVAKGGQNRLRLDFDVGIANVQVIDAGVAVSADVSFYQRLKGGKPTGEPVLAGKAGQEAYLAPGVYALAVTRKGEVRMFGELKIAAGRTVERAIEWAPPPPPPPAAEAKPEDAKKIDAKKDEAKKSDGKKADEKKPEETKADEKKADDKKANEKKANEKKADEKKADEKKAEEKKPEEKKADEKKPGEKK